MTNNYLDPFSNDPDIDLRILGLTHAIQTLGRALITTTEQKVLVSAITDGLANVAFDSKLSQKQKDAYLNGLSALNQSVGS
jgi:hypothetical protein